MNAAKQIHENHSYVPNLAKSLNILNSLFKDL